MNYREKLRETKRYLKDTNLNRKERRRLGHEVENMYSRAKEGSLVIRFFSGTDEVAGAVRRASEEWGYKYEGHIDGERREICPIDTLYSDGRIVAFTNPRAGEITLIGKNREQMARSIGCVMAAVFQNLDRKPMDTEGKTVFSFRESGAKLPVAA
jgi:hypothetical protein